MKRKTVSEEELRILPCPFCNSGVRVTDCGYSSFNPGNAYCGECGRGWKLGFVDSEWDAGLRWNELQPKAVEIEQLKNRLKELGQ